MSVDYVDEVVREAGQRNPQFDRSMCKQLSEIAVRQVRNQPEIHTFPQTQFRVSEDTEMLPLDRYHATQFVAHRQRQNNVWLQRKTVAIIVIVTNCLLQVLHTVRQTNYRQCFRVVWRPCTVRHLYQICTH